MLPPIKTETPSFLDQALAGLTRPADSANNTRKNFDAEQMRQESGGRQHDKNGNPLVGRYRDGTTPSKGKQAFGAGQMQIGTAKETAKKHGIPFDENRFMNDKEYNLDLADKHMGDLLQRYGGDRVKAKAAYHSGAGTVDKAIRTHGSDKFHLGLGPEGQAYIGRGNKTSQGTGPDGKPIKAPPSRFGTDATAQEKAALNQETNYEITNPFTKGAELGKEVANAESRADSSDDVIMDAIARIQAITPQKKELLEQTVAAKTAINDDIQARTQDIIDRAKPLFQRREAIANRRAEMQGMSPFKRAIKGIFNPGYDNKTLNSVEATTNNQLAVITENHRELNQFQSVMLQSLQAEATDQESLLNFEVDDANEDSRLAIGALASANAQVASTTQALSLQGQLTATQARARQEVLSKLSPEQVNVALADARKNGSTAMVNGVELSIGELEEQSIGWQEKDLSLRSRQMALQSQELNIADMHETKIIENMTTGELTQAIQNGGEYQGQQLNLTKLTQGLQNAQARDGLIVNEAASAGAVDQFKSMNQAILAGNKSSIARMQQIFGKLPPSQAAFVTQQSNRLQQIASIVTEANKSGTGEKAIQSLLPEMTQLLQQQDAQITAMAARWAGGNKDMQAAGEAWMRGEPMTDESAAKGLIAMARGGMPANNRMTGPAAQTFKKIEAIVREHDSPSLKTAGTALEALNQDTKQSKAARERELQARVRNLAAQQFVDSNLNESINNAPQLAREVKVNGKQHPFSRVRQSDWNYAIQKGDEDGYDVMANRMGLKSGEEAKRLFAQGERGAMWAEIKNREDSSGNKFSTTGFAGLTRQLNVSQTQSAMKILDSSASADDSFIPSQAYADLMSNPQFMRTVSDQVSRSVQGNFGAFIAGTPGVNRFDDALINYSRTVASSQVAYRDADRNRIVESQRRFKVDPYMQASMVLGAVDGLNQREEKLLLSAIKSQVGDISDSRTNVLDGYYSVKPKTVVNQDQMADYNSQIDQVILSGKFDDPNLERIRRIAAKDWKAYRDRTERSFNRFIGGGE